MLKDTITLPFLLPCLCFPGVGSFGLTVDRSAVGPELRSSCSLVACSGRKSSKRTERPCLCEVFLRRWRPTSMLRCPRRDCASKQFRLRFGMAVYLFGCSCCTRVCVVKGNGASHPMARILTKASSSFIRIRDAISSSSIHTVSLAMSAILVSLMALKS